MTAPERYRKKPVVIDALQWTGDNLRAVICFTDGPPDTRTNHAGMMWEKYEDLVQREGLKIYTLEGTMNADVGDYIIKGVKGEFYPCKPDIFSATYAPADLAADPRDAVIAQLVEALEAAEELYQTGLLGASRDLIDAVPRLRAAALAAAKGGAA